MTKKKSVCLVEMVVYDNMLPLVAGYLEAYARADPAIDGACSFEKLTWLAGTPADTILGELARRRADVYAFSVYMWNSVVTLRVARGLAQLLPQSYIVLGGPQVMNYGEKYLDRNLPNIWIANGAGEIVFRNFLKDVVLGDKRVFTLRGVSAYAEGELISTGGAEDVHDLATIPSPFLTGLFDSFKFASTTYETNRGCPYTCTFCFFSKGDSTKLYKFETERIKDELTWLAQRSLSYLFMADANFGIFDRDVEITEHICRLHRQYGRPRIVNFSAAKNKPERVSQITTTLHAEGVVVSQPVSFQSLNEETLTTIRRKNIKQEKYAALQKDLERKGIPTMIELIWPLPGETPASFRSGIDAFCRKHADTLSIYPLVLLNNTEMSSDRERFGAQTYNLPSEISEVEIVTATSTVCQEEYQAGLRMIYGLYALYNMRGFGRLCHYLDGARGISYTETFARFAEFARRDGASDFARRMEQDLATYDYYYSFKALGSLAYSSLHLDRSGFLELLLRYARSCDWWSDAQARALLEMDLICLPYAYEDTPLTTAERLNHHFSALRVVSAGERSYTVEVPESYAALLGDVRGLDAAGLGGARWIVNHRRGQFRHKGDRSEQHHAEYCYGMVKRPNAIRPMESVEPFAADFGARHFIPEGTSAA